MQDKTRVSHPTPGHWARMGAAAALVALSLSGCALTDAMGIYWEGARPQLPQLSAEQLALQSVARHDAGLQQAIGAWKNQDGASECAACTGPLEILVEHAEERVLRAGGVWDPWPAGVPSEAPTLEPLPVPAPEVPALVEQAITSAVVDLRLGAQAKVDTRRLVGAAAAGRISDALSLARVAGVDEKQLDAWFQAGGELPLPEDFTADKVAPSALSASATTTSTTAEPSSTSPTLGAGSSASPTPPTSSPTALPASARSAVSRAIREWDCVQDLLPRWAAAPDSEDGPPAPEVFARQQVDDLANTIAVLLARQVPDQRLGSCSAYFKQFANQSGSAGSSAQMLVALENRLAATNLELFVSEPELEVAQLDSARGLSLPAEQLVRAVDFWQKVAGTETVPALVGLVTPAPAAQP